MWVPTNDSGFHWVYRTEEGIMASCDYQYMRVKGVRHWQGKMWKMNTDFMGGTDPYIQSGLEELAGCVAWVEHNLYGGYWI